MLPHDIPLALTFIYFHHEPTANRDITINFFAGTESKLKSFIKNNVSQHTLKLKKIRRYATCRKCFFII